jgi:hypothetical protein
MRGSQTDELCGLGQTAVSWVINQVSLVMVVWPKHASETSDKWVTRKNYISSDGFYDEPCNELHDDMKELTFICARFVTLNRTRSTFTWCGQLRQYLVCMRATWNSMHRINSEINKRIIIGAILTACTSVLHVQQKCTDNNRGENCKKNAIHNVARVLLF